MDYWKLFVVALMPVLKVLLITVVGTFLTLNRINVLGEIARKNINTMVFYVFSPSLVFSSMAKSITLRSMIMLWFMPVNIILTVIIGTFLGWLLLKIVRVPHYLQGLVLGCCSVGNMGILPLIIVPAVCKERNNPFGDVNVCYRNGLAYASLSLAIGSIVVWAYAYNIVRIYSQKKSNLVKFDESKSDSAFATEIDPENHGKGSTGALATAADDESQTNNSGNQLEVEILVPDEQTKMQKKEKGMFIKHFKILAKMINLKALIPPTLIGAGIGMIIGIVPQFRKLLIGEIAPLHVVQDSLVMLGEACIPCITLLVGANLLKGLKGKRVQFPLIVGIIVIRYIVLPTVGICIVKGAIHFGLIHHDPLYEFLLLLQFTVPPAISISIFTQLFDAGEGEYSVIMLVTYSSAVISLTLWCTFFMWLVI